MRRELEPPPPLLAPVRAVVERLLRDVVLRAALLRRVVVEVADFAADEEGVATGVTSMVV